MSEFLRGLVSKLPLKEVLLCPLRACAAGYGVVSVGDVDLEATIPRTEWLPGSQVLFRPRPFALVAGCPKLVVAMVHQRGQPRPTPT